MEAFLSFHLGGEIETKPIAAQMTLLSVPPTLGGCDPDPTWPINDVALATEVLKLTNDYREGKGLGKLQHVPTLASAAAWKSAHMAQYAYMAHNDPAPPTARSTADRIAACGYSGAWAENIAYGYPNPQSVMNGWINSPGHKANIERAGYTGLGVGAAMKNGTWHWTQCFGMSYGQGPAPPIPPTPLVPRIGITSPRNGMRYGHKIPLKAEVFDFGQKIHWTLYINGVNKATYKDGALWSRQLWLKSGKFTLGVSALNTETQVVLSSVVSIVVA